MNPIHTIGKALTALAIASTLVLSSQADPVTYRSSVQLPAAERTDAEEAIALRKAAKITLRQATAAAEKAVPGGELLESELDSEDGNVIYEFEFLDQGAERKVIVDAGNGRILANYIDRD